MMDVCVCVCAGEVPEPGVPTVWFQRLRARLTNWRGHLCQRPRCVRASATDRELYCRSLCRTILFEWRGGRGCLRSIYNCYSAASYWGGGGVLALSLLLDCCSIIRHAHERTLARDQNIDIIDTYTCIRAHVINKLMDASAAYPPPPPPRLEVDTRSLKLYSPNGPRSGVVLVFLTQYDKNLWLAKISQVRGGGGRREGTCRSKKGFKVLCYGPGMNMETKTFYMQI